MFEISAPPNRRPLGQADPPLWSRTKVGQGKFTAWRWRLFRLDAGSTFSFGRSGGEFSEPTPFGWPPTACGCVAAENLGRLWIGVDISPKAVDQVNMRLHQSMGDLFHNRLVAARTDIPRRTDIDARQDPPQSIGGAHLPCVAPAPAPY